MTTEHDSPSRLREASETTLFKYLTPGLVSFALLAGGSYIHDIRADLQTLKDAAAENKAILADKEGRLKRIEDLIPRREQQLSNLDGRLTALEKEMAIVEFETNHPPARR